MPPLASPYSPIDGTQVKVGGPRSALAALVRPPWVPVLPMLGLVAYIWL